jgi:hypothetical protein
MSANAADHARPWSGRFRSPWARPLLFTAAVILLLAAQGIGSAVYGNQRTPPQISAQLARQGSADVAVVFHFSPEQFHLSYLQGLGNIVKQTGDTVYMSGLTSSAVRDIAGQYWVAAVLPWNGH